MPIDPNVLIGGVATVVGATVAGALALVGNRGRRQQEQQGVSLTKVIDGRVADLKEQIAVRDMRIDELEAETRDLRDERNTARFGREQLLHENEFLGSRNKELENFDDSDS